jgi:hypothetical protein
MKIVFDLEGALLDVTGGLDHNVAGTYWRKHDEGHTVEVWSNRPIEQAGDLMSFFSDNDLPVPDLFRMRAADCTLGENMMKEQWLLESILDGCAPTLVYEGRELLANMYTYHGTRVAVL